MHAYRRTAAFVAAVVTVGAVGAVAVPAHATPPLVQLAGNAASVEVDLLHGAVTSNVWAASGLRGTKGGLSAANTLAHLNLANVVVADALGTGASTAQVAGGYAVTSVARIAHLNVLAGIVTADALTSTTTARTVNGVGSGTSTSQAVNLRVLGQSVPNPIPPHYSITIPGIARIDFGVSSVLPNGAKVVATGAAIVVTILGGSPSAPAGSTIVVDPTAATIGMLDDPGTGHCVRGLAFGTSAVLASPIAGFTSDPTVPKSLPLAGTAGKTRTSSLAAVHLAPVLETGVIDDSVAGVNTPAQFSSDVSSRVAGVSLFGGVITADAVTSAAHVAGGTGRRTAVSGTSALLHLVINGTPVDAAVPPNTVIQVPNLLRVTINQQLPTSKSITVRALDVVLTTAAFGLPAGAEIQVASAWASGE